MTGGTFLGRRFVEQDALAGNLPHQFVAAIAAHIAVFTLQWERSALTVVEKRWLPLRAVVAIPAPRDLVLCKLLAVDVFVTAFTLSRGSLEVYIGQPSLLVWRFVAVHARGCTMSANQRESGCRMIEAGQLFPGLGAVAGFAAD